MTNRAVPRQTEMQLAGGDRAAAVARPLEPGRPSVGELIERYDAPLKRVVRRRISPELRRHIDESDLLQEVYLTAHQRLTKVVSGAFSDLLPWLARIAENKLNDKLDYLFARKRDTRRDISFDGPRPAGVENPRRSLVSNAPSPFDCAVASELAELREACLELLPREHRQVIVLREECGCSWGELRDRMQRPTEAAARELYRRARTQLATRVAVRLGPERELACA